MGGLEQRTIPRQILAGIREQISPTILAVRTLLIAFAVFVLFTVKWLHRRSSSNDQTGANFMNVLLRGPPGEEGVGDLDRAGWTQCPGGLDYRLPQTPRHPGQAVP